MPHTHRQCLWGELISIKSTCGCGVTVRGVYLAVYITSYSTQHSEVIPWRIHVAFYMWAVNVQFAVGWYQSWLPNTPPKCLCDWMLNRGPDFICSGWLDLVPVAFLSNTISHLILRTELDYSVMISRFEGSERSSVLDFEWMKDCRDTGGP